MPAYPERWDVREERVLNEMDAEAKARERRLKEIEATFDAKLPWYRDPVLVAKLLRWLELLDEEPRDIPLFIESAATWEPQYKLMMSLVK